MRKVLAGFEIFIQLAIFYSLGEYFAELELTTDDPSLVSHPFFVWSERCLALIFTVEYLIRWGMARWKWKYPFTPMALVDLAAVLPFYFSFMIDMRGLRLIRTLRVLRLFKLFRYNEALRNFTTSFGRVKREMYILGVAVVFVVFISGTLMYEAERDRQPEMFKRYSDGIWWSVVTLTTVGYGDKYPVTHTGRIIAAVTLIAGLGLFGSFVSLFGGAFVATLNENRQQERRIVLGSETERRIRRILAFCKRPDDEAQVHRLVEEALDKLDPDATLRPEQAGISESESLSARD